MNTTNGDIESPLELGYLHKELKQMDYSLARVILSALSFVVVIIMAIAGWLAFQKITKNHLHHLDLDIKDVKMDVKENTKNIRSIEKNVAVIATKLECTIE